MSFCTFLCVSSFKAKRKQANIHAQISAYITLCVFAYVSLCPAPWMDPLSCHLLLSCSWGGASESKQTANWGCQRRIAETTPRPGVTHPYQAPHSALFTLPIPPLSSLSSIHQQSCTPTSRLPHGNKYTNTHMQTLSLHTFMHPLDCFLLYSLDGMLVNPNRYQSVFSLFFFFFFKTVLIYCNHSPSLTWFEHSNLICLVLSLILIYW